MTIRWGWGLALVVSSMAAMAESSDWSGYLSMEPLRLGEARKLEAKARVFLNVGGSNPFLGGFRNDSFITLRVTGYL